MADINDFDDFDSLEDLDVRPSKSQRKREVLALQELGKALVTLTPKQLAGLQLPDELLKAIHEAQRMRKHEAQRRQLQFIGRVMRDVDEATQLRIKQHLKSLGK
jgi:ribosome-associated protein